MPSVIRLLVLASVLALSLWAWAQTPEKPAAPPAAPPAAAPTEPPAAPPADKPAAKPETPAPPAADKPAVKPEAPPAAKPATSPKTIRGGGPGKFYDPSTLETVVGEVVQVQRGPLGKKGKVDMVRLTLKTDQETILVFLGPATFVDAQPLKLAPGDKVEVTGSRQRHAARGLAFINAGALKKDGQVMQIRDDQGKPLWRGQGQGPRRGRGQ